MGAQSASTVVSALYARSAVGLNLRARSSRSMRGVRWGLYLRARSYTLSVQGAAGLESASTVVAARARSAVGLKSASTVVGAISASSVEATHDETRHSLRFRALHFQNVPRREVRRPSPALRHHDDRSRRQPPILLCAHLPLTRTRHTTLTTTHASPLRHSHSRRRSRGDARPSMRSPRHLFLGALLIARIWSSCSRCSGVSLGYAGVASPGPRTPRPAPPWTPGTCSRPRGTARG